MENSEPVDPNVEFVTKFVETHGLWLEKVFKHNTSEHQLKWEIYDFAQELYLRLIRSNTEKLPDLDDETAVRRFIATCARNVIRDRVRFLKRRPKELSFVVGENHEETELSGQVIDSQSPTPDQQILHDEEIKMIRAIFGQYSTRTATIGDLKLQGMSHGEISKLIGHSKDIVAKRWQLLSLKIKQRLTNNR